MCPVDVYELDWGRRHSRVQFLSLWGGQCVLVSFFFVLASWRARVPYRVPLPWPVLSYAV